MTIFELDLKSLGGNIQWSCMRVGGGPLFFMLFQSVTASQSWSSLKLLKNFHFSLPLDRHTSKSSLFGHPLREATTFFVLKVFCLRWTTTATATAFHGVRHHRINQVDRQEPQQQQRQQQQCTFCCFKTDIKTVQRS